LEKIADPENYPFYYMRVNPKYCAGCSACIAGGRDGLRINGCPWDAIDMIKLPPDDRINLFDESGIQGPEFRNVH
jgi:ferredoxin